MKFIFPQNYDFKNKLFGVFEYSIIIVNVIWDALIIFILHSFIHSFNVQFFIFILCCFPLFLFSISGINGENILYVFHYMFVFIIKQKLFFYSKNQ